jgi:hypothetical protein
MSLALLLEPFGGSDWVEDVPSPLMIISDEIPKKTIYAW